MMQISKCAHVHRINPPKQLMQRPKRLDAHHSHALLRICSPERSAELMLVSAQRTGKRLSPHQTARQLANASKVHELSRWGVAE